MAQHAVLMLAAVGGGDAADSMRALVMSDGSRIAGRIANCVDVGQYQRARAEAGKQDDSYCRKARARALMVKGHERPSVV